MDLELNDDQRELRSIAADLLDGRGDLAPARAALDGGGDDGSLADEVAELGWTEVGLEDDDPFGIPGLCLLCEQIGAHAAPIGLVDGAVIARLARATSASTPAARTALCVVEEGAGWRLEDLTAQAIADGPGSVRVSTRKLGVHHGAGARLFAVLAQLDGEPAAMLVDAAADGVSVSAQAGLDPSVAPAQVTFDDVVVARTSVLGGQALVEAMAIGAVATAAEGIGAATRALAMATAYAQERRQFGRPIGSFQALAHLLAEQHVRREAAWSAVLYAAASLDERTDDALAAASVAKAYASTASREIVEGALQVFGGIGFTWEHDAHLLQRRVLECERRFGDAIDHEARLAAGLVAG